jgi:hypothetical protein
MSSLDLPKPWTYKNNWMIWPETVFDVIEITDCNDTVKGFCEKKNTIEECIEECGDHCGAGYYIEFENGNTICASIRTDVHPYLSPVHRLKKKEIYPELDNVKISSFVNTKYFPFPPEEANVVFFEDIFNIVLVDEGSSIKAGNINNDRTFVLLDKENNGDNLQIVQSVVTAGQLAKYIPVRYGQPVHITTPATSLLITVTQDNTVEWKSISDVFYTKETTFTFIPTLKTNKKKDELVTYGDEFIITYDQGKYLVVVDKEDTSKLKIVYDNLEKVISNNKLHYKFVMSSKMMGYYCDGRQCKSVPIKDIVTSNYSGTYKDVTVGRHPSCWGACKYLILGTNSLLPLDNHPPSVKRKKKSNLTIIAIFFLIIIIIIILLVRS